MVIEVTQSPEADLDREIERLIGEMVRGNIVARDRVRLGELQSQRAKLLRTPAPTPSRRPTGFIYRRMG